MSKIGDLWIDMNETFTDLYIGGAPLNEIISRFSDRYHLSYSDAVDAVKRIDAEQYGPPNEQP